MFRVFVIHLQQPGDIARQVVSGHRNDGRKKQRVSVVDRQVGGLRANIDHRHTPRPILWQNRRVRRRNALENGFVYRQMRLMHCRDKRLMILHGGGDDVNVCFESRAQHAFRIAIPRAAIECKILRTDLQNLAVLLELHPRAEFHCIAQIVGLDIAPPAELV